MDGPLNAGAPITARRSWLRAALLALTLLAGCGGGIWIELGDEWDAQYPSVSVAAASDTVTAGGTLRVVAAATDDTGIDEVEFFRRDGSGWTRLGSDRSEPYEWLVPVPADGRVRLEVFARATDFAGWQTDSAVLVVTVLP